MTPSQMVIPGANGETVSPSSAQRSSSAHWRLHISRCAARHRREERPRLGVFGGQGLLLALAAAIVILPAVCRCALAAEQNPTPKVNVASAENTSLSAPVEERVIVPLAFTETRRGTGSFSMMAMGDGRVASIPERPSDSLIPVGGSSNLGKPLLTIHGPSRTEVWSGRGSEVRFAGSVAWGDVRVVAAPESQLCFKKANEGWAYLCGVGTVKLANRRQAISLGDKRTVDSCLGLLSSEDPILREGAARDLGRLTSEVDRERVVPGLSALLTGDPDASVRRGAAEGLGLIGDEQCLETLGAARGPEDNDTTRLYIAEARALCAGNVIISGHLPARRDGSDIARLYSSEKTRWIDVLLAKRIKAQGASAVSALMELVESRNARERRAAVELLGVGKCREARQVVERLSRRDRDSRVRSAAKDALKNLPESR